jgi:nucleoid-associated protein YgaU
MPSRSLILTVGGLAAAAIVAAIAYWFLVLQPRSAPPASVVTATFAPTPASSSPAPAAAPSSPAAAPTAEPGAAKPTTAALAPSPAPTPAFDVVRVEPTGDAVVAGRAAPGAKVVLSDDGKAIGDVDANDAGQFVILPPTFSPGRHPLRLSAKVGEGAPQVSDVVVVEVAGTPAAVAAAPPATPSPAAKPAPQPTVAAAATPTPTSTPAAAPTPASTPVASAASTPAPSASAAVTTPAAPAVKPSPTAVVAVAVASVRPVDPAGLEAVGSAPPGAHVRLRLNNAVLAEVVAGPDGEWRLTIERGVTAGDYVLEAVVVDAAGAVLARAESPFVYPQHEAVASVAVAAPAAAPSPTASSPASPASVEPTPAASSPVASTPAVSTPTASTPAASTSAASTPTATAEPAPSPSATIAAAEPSPTASAASTPVAPAPSPTASVAAQPARSAPAPAQTAAVSESPAATPSHAVVPEVLTYTVVKGDNLWDLAIKYYGDGLRYADIFSANASQIHDPNLIFIGQIFVVPGKPTTNPPPAR